MWYQVSSEQAAIIVGALERVRVSLERDLRKGQEWPFFTTEDMILELSQVLELKEKFTDDGSLALPLGAKVLKW